VQQTVYERFQKCEVDELCGAAHKMKN